MVAAALPTTDEQKAELENLAGSSALPHRAVVQAKTLLLADVGVANEENAPVGAVGRSILVAIWHILSTPGATFIDLDTDYFDYRINPERRVRNHVRDLQALGYRVILEPAA